MLNIDAHTRVYISATPLDFRRQIDGLSLAVQETLQLDPFLCVEVYYVAASQKPIQKVDGVVALPSPPPHNIYCVFRLTVTGHFNSS